MGPDDGKGMIDQLQGEIDKFNEQCNQFGGRAEMQPFLAATYACSDTDSDTDSNSEKTNNMPSPKKKKKLREAYQPLIIAICTPLMSRAHRMVRQSREIVFCDSTSTLDRFGNSMSVISTTHAACSVPLGVLIVSDEKQETIHQGFEMLTLVLHCL